MLNSPVVMAGVSPAIRAVEEDIRPRLPLGREGAHHGRERRRQGNRRAPDPSAQQTRRTGPLVTINCAGFPDSLLETEMFGHMKGSFTDAYRDKRGWLELANGGTIFMDEVGEMSLRMQALLLRFLESGEIQRVGSERGCRRSTSA